MGIAAITGASSGLGAEFARQLLGRKELDEIWLIARRREKMDELCAALADRARTCRLRVLLMDLTEESALAEYSDLLKRERPQVRWLINAAGFGKMGTNEEIGLEALDKMVLLNCKAAMDMTQRTMPYLVRGSHVLEICSTAAFQPLGGLGVYQYLADWGGAGATVPLTGFGYLLVKGVKKAVAEQGFLGALTGGITAAAGGITAATFFGFLVALIFRSRPKK